MWFVNFPFPLSKLSSVEEEEINLTLTNWMAMKKKKTTILYIGCYHGLVCFPYSILHALLVIDNEEKEEDDNALWVDKIRNKFMYWPEYGQFNSSRLHLNDHLNENRFIWSFVIKIQQTDGGKKSNLNENFEIIPTIINWTIVK